MKLSEDTEGWNLVIWRCQPLHEDHIAVVRQLLKEGSKVCIGIRKSATDKDNPFTMQERIGMIKREFKRELKKGTVCYVPLPNIKTICYGSNLAWNIREIMVGSDRDEIIKN